QRHKKKVLLQSHLYPSQCNKECCEEGSPARTHFSTNVRVMRLEFSNANLIRPLLLRQIRLHGEERKQLKLMLEITDHRQGCGDIADTAVQSLRVHISRKLQRAGSIRPTTITNFQITSRGC